MPFLDLNRPSWILFFHHQAHPHYTASTSVRYLKTKYQPTSRMNSQTHGLISLYANFRIVAMSWVNPQRVCECSSSVSRPRTKGDKESRLACFPVKTELLPTNASVIQSSQPVSASTNAPAPSWQSTPKAHKQVDEEYHNHY